MNEYQDNHFCIILWSRENIRIDNIDLKTSIQSDSPGLDIQIFNLNDLQKMRFKDLRRLLEIYAKNSAFIVCPSDEKLEDVDFCKLGFVMGKMSISGSEGKKIIGYMKKESKNSIFDDLSELFLRCDDEFEIKSEMKTLLKSMGYKTTFNHDEFTAGANIAGKKG